MKLVLSLVLVALVSGQRASAQPGPAAAAQREGRITISRGTAVGVSTSSVEASFMDAPVRGAVIGSYGPCALRRHISSAGLSAGTIAITGTTQPIALEPSPAGRGVRYASQDGSFADGATLTVTASGGADIAAFTASVTVPDAPAGFEPLRALPRTGATATWPPESGTEIMIVVGVTDPRIGQGLLLECRVPDTGSFTLPARALALIPAGFDQAVVILARVAKTEQLVGDAWITVEAVSGIVSGPFTLPAPATAPPAPARTAAPPIEIDPHRESPRLFLGVSFGFGGASRIGDVAPTRGSTTRLQLGQRLDRGLHLVEEVAHLDAAISSPAGVSEAHDTFGVGIRWTPFEPRLHRFPKSVLIPGPFIDSRAFYVTAVVGADLRTRFTPATSTVDTASSPAAALSLGLLEIQGHDWALGPEFREQLAYFDGHVQRSWMFLLAAHLNGW